MIEIKSIQNKRIVAAIISILIFMLLAGCADRKRTNPLDPQNPKTHGKPQHLRVYSELNHVYLSWNPVNLDDLRGYRIYRKAEKDVDFTPIHDVPPDSALFVDKNVTYNTRYTYQLTILGEDFETEPSDSDSIIPGPTTIWVGDVYDRHIFKLSHDCAHEIFHLPISGYPWALALEKKQNQMWLTDVLFNEIVRVDLANLQQVAIGRFYYGDPVDIEIDETNDLVWVADEDSGVVHIYSINGLQLKELPGFQRISDIACYFTDGSCWVIDSGQKKLFSVRKDFRITKATLELQYPFRCAVNQNDGALWLLDDNKLLKLNLLGKLEFAVEYQFNDPYDIAVDSENGRVWILDWYDGANNSRLICLSSDGEKIWDRSGFTYPENVIGNPDDHGCIIADTGNGRVVKITDDGDVFGEIDGFYYPYGLVVDKER